MKYGKFLLCGEDKKTLATVKNTLAANGHIFIGYTREHMHLLRNIRASEPEMVIVDVGNNFRQLKRILEVMDEDLLSACILILDSRNDEVFEYLKNTRVMTYIAKPVFSEAILQIADISLINYKRILEYEEKVKKLNDTLESRKTVEKAKWILMESEGISETEAYEAIRKKSRNNRMPMREIAEAIILTRG